MQIYYIKKTHLRKKRIDLAELVCDTNMTAVELFRKTKKTCYDVT